MQSVGVRRSTRHPVDGAANQVAPTPTDTDACLQRIRESLGVPNDGALAEFLAVPYPTVASWRRRKSIPLDAFISVARRTGATLDWLILGRLGDGPGPLKFDLDDATFDYSLAFALASKGMDAKQVAGVAETVRTFYYVISGVLQSLEEKGLTSEEDKRQHMERWLARATTGR